jgi:hypothetical protein
MALQILFTLLVVATNVFLFRYMINHIDTMIKASFLPLMMLPTDLAFSLPKVKEVIAGIIKKRNCISCSVHGSVTTSSGYLRMQ